MPSWVRACNRAGKATAAAHATAAATPRNGPHPESAQSPATKGWRPRRRQVDFMKECDRKGPQKEKSPTPTDAVGGTEREVRQREAEHDEVKAFDEPGRREPWPSGRGDVRRTDDDGEKYRETGSADHHDDARRGGVASVFEKGVPAACRMAEPKWRRARRRSRIMQGAVLSVPSASPRHASSSSTAPGRAGSVGIDWRRDSLRILRYSDDPG
jgi:hypothetical protein